jgi:UDP-glucose 4-epimerase
VRSLVTGGAGFIGSHLVATLLDLGHDVCVLDNFSTGRPQNLDHVKDNSKLQVHQVDIGSGADMASFFDGVERVYHLAALADIVPSIEQPEAYHRTNVDGTFHVLQAANRAKIKRFVYIASSSCYGLPDINPTPEDADIRPMYPYALTKYIGESYVIQWAQLYGLPAVSLRLFNVYGPRSRTSGTYGAVFGVFLAQKLAGKPFTVVGDGTQTRDFTFVSDVVSAILLAADSDLSGEFMNVGSGDTYSVNRLVELLGGEVTYIPKRPGEPDCTFANTQKIWRLLNWQPKVSFEDGVKEMLDNIDYWREAPLWEPASIAEATTDWFKYLANRDE